VIGEKYAVLRDHFNLQNILISNDEIKQKAAVIGMTIEKGPVDVSVLQKKLRYSKRIPTRKLYISDLHFFHDSLNHRMDMRGFSDYEEMNAHMIRQWNDHVTKKDEVYILGDFSISRGKAANEVLEQLNGKKYLIEGNHDKFLDDKEFDRSLFRWIRPYAEIRDCRRQVILSHYPVFCYKGQYRMTPEGTPLTYMLYGHVHNTHDERLVNEFIRIPKKSEILALAESMNHSEGQAIGTVEDMIYEMNSAMQDMIFRWNFCKEAYAGPVRSRDGKRQIKDLAAEGIEYLKEIRKGKLWKRLF